jgi:hypothetical protein
MVLGMEELTGMMRGNMNWMLTMVGDVRDNLRDREYEQVFGNVWGKDAVDYFVGNSERDMRLVDFIRVCDGINNDLVDWDETGDIEGLYSRFQDLNFHVGELLQTYHYGLKTLGLLGVQNPVHVLEEIWKECGGF